MWVYKKKVALDVWKVCGVCVETNLRYLLSNSFIARGTAPSRSLLCHPASLVANERVKDDVVEFFSLNDAVRKFYEQFWKHCFVVEVRSGKGALEESDFQLQFGFPFLLLMLLLLLFVLFEE